jgi:hypothetical protein
MAGMFPDSHNVPLPATDIVVGADAPVCGPDPQ